MGETSALLPMVGLAFVLYTYYMVTDPATTPEGVRGQLVFGAAVAAVYALLVSFHVVFGLFFALTAVCALRGTWLYAQVLAAHWMRPKIATGTPAVVGRAES